MVNKYYDNITDFAAVISKTYCDLKNPFIVSVVCKYDAAVDILRMMCQYNYNPAFVQLSDVKWDGYDDEFVLSLYNNEVSVEKMKHGDVYYSTEADVIFIMDDCSSRVIPKCKSENVICVEVGEEGYCSKETPKDDREDMHQLIYALESWADSILDFGNALGWRG